jgi:hypothetical protein
VIGTRCEQDEEMERGWLVGFFEACEMASHTMADAAVVRRWSDPSALRDLTVGGIAGHLYAAIRRLEVALDEDLPPSRRVVALPEFYGLNRIDELDGIDAGWHPLLRDEAEQGAADGPQAVAERLAGVVSRLTARLPSEPPDRLVPVSTIHNAATRLDAYVATRVVELVVHSDDLAASVGLEPLSIPERAASSAIEVFVEMARHRTGDLGVIRAFARGERSVADALRVL